MFSNLIDLWTGWMGFGDPRTADYPLVAEPAIPLGLCAAYVLFSTKIGPRLMKNRPPFECKTPMIAYNAFQIVANIYVFAQLLIARPWLKFIDCCNTKDHHVMMKVAFVAWYFYVLKIADFIDTIFMVLRKKNKQISFLHVYHHTGMVFGLWMSQKYLIVGPMVFFGVLNSFVHAIMYSYYLLTAIRPEYKKSIWWKRHITELQMLQFILIAIQHTIHILVRRCDFPIFWTGFFVAQVIFMLAMFWDFYKKTYLQSSDKKQKNR